MKDSMTVLRKISHWMTQMGIENQFGKVVVGLFDKIPAIFSQYTSGEIGFLVLVIVRDQWINVKSLVGSIDQISPEKRERIYHDCLKANYELNEVTFSADPKGSIWVEADMTIDTSFNYFNVEFNSIAVGLEAFAKVIAPKHGIALESTSEKRDVLD